MIELNALIIIVINKFKAMINKTELMEKLIENDTLIKHVDKRLLICDQRITSLENKLYLIMEAKIQDLTDENIKIKKELDTIKQENLLRIRENLKRPMPQKPWDLILRK